MPEDITTEFHKKEDLDCPYCGSVLRFRERATDDNDVKIRRAHFWHAERAGKQKSSRNQIGGCDAGGESAEHEISKMWCLGSLRGKYRGSSFVERKIGNRIADCGIEFDRTASDMRGIVVELQYKNDGKDYRKVTEEYLKHGFAVHWVFALDGDWDPLFSAKNALELTGKEDYWLGRIEEETGEVDLGDKLWFNNYPYEVDSLTDLISGDMSSANIKIDLPWISDPSSAYLVVEGADIDTTEPELSLSLSSKEEMAKFARALHSDLDEDQLDNLYRLLRKRPSKAIANAKFD